MFGVQHFIDNGLVVIFAAILRVAAPGERAVLVFPPGLEFIAAFFGCLYAGVLPAPATYPKLRGLRTLVLDMLRYRAHPTHLTVDEALRLADEIAAERTYFIHMTHDIRHAELDPQLPKGMSLAYDGLMLRGDVAPT